MNCGEAIRALACEVQDASTALSELRTAISCHHSETFSLLWSDFLKRQTHREFFDLLIFSRQGSQLIAALAHRSSLERTMLHGLDCSSAQTSIIVAVLGSLSELVTEKYYEDENTRRAAFVEMAGEGLEQILQLGDLDIAIQVGQITSSRSITTFSDELHGQGVLKSALDMACSGCFDLDRSKQFLDFARNCRKNLNPDFQALRAMIEHNSVALFQRCVEDGTDVSGCDEDGQNLLHCMILAGFYTLVPVSLVISYGTDPNHPDRNSQTPLHLAAKVGSPLLVKELLDKGAESSAVDNDGASVLFHAIDSRNLSVVEMILEALEANLKGSQVVSLFGQFLNRIIPKLRDHSSSSSAEDCLIEFGTFSYDNTEDGMTALLLAARNHDTKIVGTLLRHGARLDAMDSNGNTALHYAIDGSENEINDVISCSPKNPSCRETKRETLHYT